MNKVTSTAGFKEFWRNRLVRGLAVLYASVWICAAIQPLNREDWLLENLLVFLALPMLVVLFRWRLLSNASYVFLFAFFTLHAIGAHFTYTEVPLGNLLRDYFHWSRNHYDRLVHFTFGLLMVCPIKETLAGLNVGGRLLSCLLAVHVVMAWSALYEMIEAAVAHLVSPELGAAYNGVQGDIWDAQKDAALAMMGAILGVTMTALMARARATARLFFPQARQKLVDTSQTAASR